MNFKNALRLLFPIVLFGVIGGLVEDHCFPGPEGNPKIFIVFTLFGLGLSMMLLFWPYSEICGRINLELDRRNLVNRCSDGSRYTISASALPRRDALLTKIQYELMELAERQMTLSGRNRIEDHDIDRAFNEWVDKIKRT